MGIQDSSKMNYERLNLVLVMGSPVRPCIALCWVYTRLLAARAAGSTHFFKAATVPWAAARHESAFSDHGWIPCVWGQLTSLSSGCQQKPSPNQPPETPRGGGKPSRQFDTHDRRRVRGKAQEGDAVTRAGRSLQCLPARTRIQCPPPAGGHNSQVQAKPISPQNPRPRVRGAEHTLG